MKTTDADFRLMIEAVTDYAIFLLDPSGFICSWNTGAEKLKQYQRHEILGKHFSIFYPPEMLAKQWPEHELRVATEVGRFEDEGWRIRKDGTRFWASVIITRLLDPDGNLRGFSKITRDLTERRNHEELLRHSEERFRLLVEGVSDYAIFMLDPSGHVISWNSGARNIKGYTADEIIGKHFSIFYPADVNARRWPEQELKLALANGRHEEEGWRIRKDGSRFWANVVITPLFDGNGSLRGFAKITRDLTERRRALTLAEEGRRINAFVAMLAHELRNPLAPIANAIALLDSDASLQGSAKMASDVIGRQVKQMTRLVNDLLDINRIASGALHLDKKPVALKEVLAAAIEAVAPMVSEKKQRLATQYQGHDVWVEADQARLIQIVSNILHNATKFTQAGGEIRIALKRDDSHVKISIADNGPGIAPERLPHIFNRFMHAETETQKVLGGLGLGLSLAHRLVVMHNGALDAHSAGIAGDGSEFTLTLPTIAAPAGEQRLAQNTILVVDDNRDAADSFAMVLQSQGYRALCAYTGYEALELIERAAPGVVILDIGLPDIDGIEVAKRIKAARAVSPSLIAVTGYGMESDRLRSFNAGFEAHLVKPVDIGALMKILRALTDEV